MRRVKQILRVKPGHRVEVVAPELAEGELVEVVVSPEAIVPTAGKSVVAFLDSLPDGPRAFATWQDYEQHLRREKEAWER